jgi:hypothetical protein
MLRRLLLLAAGFAYMVLLIEAVRAAVAWWQGEAEAEWLDYALIGALPVLAWVWWRHLSMFRPGCAEGACLPPPRDTTE